MLWGNFGREELSFGVMIVCVGVVMEVLCCVEEDLFGSRF